MVYSNKFMHGIVLHSIVLLCSLLYCIVNLLLGGYLTIRPAARKGYGSIAREAKPNGLLTRGP